MLFCLIQIVLERTGHRTESINFFIIFFIPHYEHSFFIMIPVTGYLIKITFCHQRSFRTDISPLCFFILDPALHFLDHNHTVRHDQRKSLPDHVNSCKQLHFTAKLIVVTFFCFFHLSEMFIQLILRSICCAIHTGEHLIFLAASPVRTGRRKKLKGLYSLCTHQMRTCTKICPVSL